PRIWRSFVVTRQRSKCCEGSLNVGENSPGSLGHEKQAARTSGKWSGVDAQGGEFQSAVAKLEHLLIFNAASGSAPNFTPMIEEIILKGRRKLQTKKRGKSVFSFPEAP